MKLTLREIAADPLIDTPAPEPTGAPMWGYGAAMLGAMLFSMKAIFAKLAYMPVGGMAENELDAITLMALRMGFALPVFIIMGVWAIRRSRVEVPVSLIIKGAVLGVLGYYICTFLDFEGLKYITAQLERLLLFTYPAFAVIFGALFFGGRLTLSGFFAILLAYAGLAVIFLRGDIATGVNVPLGSILVLSAAILFAFFQLIAKGIIDRLGSKVFTCLAMTAASIAILCHFTVVSLADEGIARALDLPSRIYLIGAAIALFSTIAPAFLINFAIGRIGAQAVAMFGMVGPVGTIIAAVFILGEPFGLVDAVGTAITILGIALYTWLDQRRNRLKP